MKLTRVAIRNYRSIDDLTLRFPTHYSAICGRNDSGKTNVLRAMRALLAAPNPYVYQVETITLKESLPKWHAKDSRDRTIEVEIDFVVDPESDAGLHQFLTTYLSIEAGPTPISARLKNSFTVENPSGSVSLVVGERSYEPLKAQEVLQKLRSSNVLRDYNSTDPAFAQYLQSRILGALSPGDSDALDSAKIKLNRSIGRIARQQQKEMGELLGRLKNKYKVALSVPAIDPSDVPFSVTLGDGNVSVPLDDWGSGTQNRTHILMALFKAHQMSLSETSASKVTPLIIVEEPESFLHPAAQAEFGTVLQTLAEEFKVQLIVATHSPYMLSQTEPSANLLLERRSERGKMRDTQLVDTSGDKWMEPFGLALGIDNEQFVPWREALFSKYDMIILVEGDTDREYLELLRDAAHGDKRLDFEGEVVGCGGKDNLKLRFLLNFIKKRYKKLFVTFDLDVANEIEPCLQEIGLQRDKDYCPIGLDDPGKRSMEGLLPERVRVAVFSAHPDLVQQAMSGNKTEQTSAKNRIKKLLLEEFKKSSKPGEEDYRNFYGLTKILSKALRVS